MQAHSKKSTSLIINQALVNTLLINKSVLHFIQAR